MLLLSGLGGGDWWETWRWSTVLLIIVRAQLLIIVCELT
jgi:hypothetical protein